MTACDHIRFDIGGYVLGALEPAEAAAVREHLATCADCAAEHARLAGLPALWAGRRAGLPVVIVNRGATRGDDLATIKVEAGCSEWLSALVAEPARDRATRLEITPRG